jgi:XTP/dITP diphosphohydrolase
MKKITNLLIGTNNGGKQKEIRELLPKYIKTVSVLDFNLKSPKENGGSFEENSLIKSIYFSKKTNLYCLADDSGLEIDLLDGAPGIYSARWGGKNQDFNKAIKKIFKELNKRDKNWKVKKIKARFICAITISFLDKNIASVKGKVDGFISPEPKGQHGFGYDPIFIPNKEKKTFGEMSPKKKYKIDHRFQAFKKIKKFL